MADWAHIEVVDGSEQSCIAEAVVGVLHSCFRSLRRYGETCGMVRFSD